MLDGILTTPLAEVIVAHPSEALGAEVHEHADRLPEEVHHGLLAPQVQHSRECAKFSDMIPEQLHLQTDARGTFLGMGFFISRSH